MAFARRTFVACVEHSPVLFNSFLLVLAILISIRRWPVFLEQQQLFNKYFRAFSVALFVLLYAVALATSESNENNAIKKEAREKYSALC